MRKKKVLVHGTLESLHEFFSDAASREFETVAILSDEPKKIAVTRENQSLEVFSPQDLQAFNYKMIDGIIFTGTEKDFGYSLLKKGYPPKKVILWDSKQGWSFFEAEDKDGTQVIFLCGLEFHIRNESDLKFFGETLWRLQTQRQIKNLNPQLYLLILIQQFQQRTGKILDFSNLQTFTEKLQWIKIFDATPLKSRLADKYAVRAWVADKIGQEYLIPLLGVWSDFDEINFDDLPNQFVLKCNHGSGMNIIVRDKKSFDRQEAREKINAWLAVDYGAQNALELHYTRINRKIIAEKFMANGDLPDLIDYKFSCFNGKVNHCKVITGRTTDERIDYFDMDWNRLKFEQLENPNSDHPEKILPPKNFELMKKLAAKLSESFAFVRVDFYEIEGRVYFGEMTFTPVAGNHKYKSEGTDEFLGSLLKLPKLTPPPRYIKFIVSRPTEIFDRHKISSAA